MDLFHGDLYIDRCDERLVGQASDGEYGCNDGAGMVQCLSMSDHVADSVIVMVSAAEKEHSVRMALEYRIYLRLSDHRRLDLLLCLEFPGFHDLDRVYDMS